MAFPGFFFFFFSFKINKPLLGIHEVTMKLSKIRHQTWIKISVTRMGDLLDFGRLFKAFGSVEIIHLFRVLVFT